MFISLMFIYFSKTFQKNIHFTPYAYVCDERFFYELAFSL